MKHLIWVFALLLYSCGDADNCKDNEMYNNTVQEGKAIEFAIKIEGGFIVVEQISDSKSILTYSYSHPHCLDIADDELTDIVSFQIPAGSTSFSYTTEVELLEARAYYRRIAFAPIDVNRIMEGQIDGVLKDNNTWEVNINIPIVNSTDSSFPSSIEYSGIFVIQ